MFLPKVRLFPLFYWFVNLAKNDKHGQTWYQKFRTHLFALECPQNVTENARKTSQTPKKHRQSWDQRSFSQRVTITCIYEPDLQSRGYK